MVAERINSSPPPRTEGGMLAKGALSEVLLGDRQLLLQGCDEIEHFALFLKRQLPQPILNFLDPAHFVLLGVNHTAPSFRLLYTAFRHKLLTRLLDSAPARTISVVKTSCKVCHFP